MMPPDTPTCQGEEDVADSILEVDSVAMVAIMAVETADTMAGTMATIGATAAEVTEVQEKTAGRVEMDKTVEAEAAMARLPATDMASPAIWHQTAWPSHLSTDPTHLQKTPDCIIG